jgi:hypothetical protein
MDTLRPASIVASTALLAGILAMAPAFAWVYPEHRDILVLTVQGLDAERRAVFDGLWREARTGHEQRLCEEGADADQGVDPDCIDWAALAAIAGDHSCSSADMAAIVLESEWILGVADVAATLKQDFIEVAARAPAEPDDADGVDPKQKSDLRRRFENKVAQAARINALRTADLNLQRADPEYATRAGSNNAHFLLARPRTDTSPQQYADIALTPGAELNAVGVYAWYHLSALQKATRLANEQLAPEERRKLTRAMLFDEAFAIHFLEDIFAAGHVAGTWGDVSQRKGTHDYYNAAGLEVFTWRGSSDSMVLMGDANMRPEDAQRAAAVVRKSLEQLLDTATGKRRSERIPHTPAAAPEPETFDVCKNNQFTARAEGLRLQPGGLVEFSEVLGSTPVPSLAHGLGAMPRFRSELGVFTGLAGSVDLRRADGGFTPAESSGMVYGVDLSARVGVGLDGVIGDAGDGLMFLSLGLRGDSSSTHSIADPALAAVGGNLTAAIPARMGYTLRTRMPFYLLPYDLLLLSPMYAFAPEEFTAMAVTASNGGLIPWQTGWATGVGRFQFVAGRELGMTYYGRIGEDRVIAPGPLPTDPARIIDLRSTNYDLPILEYRPYRVFSSNQSSTILIQFFVGADVPSGSSHVVSPPATPDLPLDTVWSYGLRLVFDWRYYPD